MHGEKSKKQTGVPGRQLQNVIHFPHGDSHENRNASACPAAPGADQESPVRFRDHPDFGDFAEDVPASVLHGLEDSCAELSPGALLLLRIDQYRFLKETFGSRNAAQLLQVVQDRLRRGLRCNDRLEKISEDEFVLLLEGRMERQQLHRVANRVMKRCVGMYTVEGHRIHVAASLGVVRFPLDAQGPAKLIRLARIALGEADPVSSASCHFFSPELLEQLQARVSMSGELEEALAQDRFLLHYQPLFEIDSQRILGAEALLRLRTRDGRLVAPDCFIPQAEEMGLILPIGRWVMREACQQLRRWHEQGHTRLRMAVNVSPVQLTDEGFVETVVEAVEEAGIAYEDLELEITEGQVVDCLPLITRAFDTLNARGVRIAIDDFGTGYSALAYLTHLHWSTVKIDRTFLANVPEGPNACRIVAAIVAMAAELGLQVTAEGVETEAQYRFLARVGCHFGQGYGYAKPQAAEAFSRLLRTPGAQGWKDAPRISSERS